MASKSIGAMLCATAALIAVAAVPAQARNEITMINIDQVLKSDDAKSQLDPEVRFYFGSQRHPAAAADFGETSVKGKAGGDTDYLACSKAFVEALEDLQKTAKKTGANAVVDVRSFFRRKENFSATQVECHSGSFSSVVELRGHLISTGK
jgi:hypothetical protein